MRRNHHVTDRILLSAQKRPTAGAVQRRLLRRGIYGYLGLVKYLLMGLVGISYKEASQIVECSSLVEPVFNLFIDVTEE